MSWLNCNKCGIIENSRSSNEYFCGTCSHVLCSACNRLKMCPIDKCPFNGIKISKTMPQKLRLYFENPNNLLKPWLKCIRFQFEQRSYCEPLLFAGTLKQMRQFKKEIKLLARAKEILVDNVKKDMKRNEKMKAYLNYCLQREVHPNRSFASIRSESSMSLNYCAALGESGVDLQFDELNMSNYKNKS